MHITLLVTDIDATAFTPTESSVEFSILGSPLGTDGWRPRTGGILLVGSADEQVAFTTALAESLGFTLAQKVEVA